MMEKEYRKIENSNIRNTATLIMLITIALIGAFMMTITSSPLIKGAAFLWIPAALQLIAGVWLGPIRGFIAGGIGAYLAGIIAYSGWGLPDIIMNLIAGGFANSMLPSFLFKYLKISPFFNSTNKELKSGFYLIIILLFITIILAIISLKLNWGIWGYSPSIILLFMIPFLLNNLNINTKQFMVGIGICIFISFISACIGYVGMIISGQSLVAGLFSAGGWFLGDVISSFLGLYILATYSKKALNRGIFIEEKIEK